MLLQGPFTTWSLGGFTRLYVDLSLPYYQAIDAIKAYRYDALTGDGEQRGVVESHVRKLRKEIESGTFTPTPFAAGLRPEHLERLKLDREGSTFSLELGDLALSQLDGGHRFASFASLLDSYENLAAKAKGDEQSKYIELTEAMAELLIEFRLFLDGNPQADFVNLQKGRAVDKSHMVSLRVRQEMETDRSKNLAYQVAKLLNSLETSPFWQRIKFDSGGTAELPIATFFASSKSDLGTSLVGLAKLGIAYNKDAAFLTNATITAFRALKEKAPAVLAKGKVLAPPPNGTRGSATLLVGVGIVLAYRLIIEDRDEAVVADAKKLAASATAKLDREVAGNFSGAVKRNLVGDFARHYFADLKNDAIHDGLPLHLLETLSTSTYDAEDLPKAAKPPKATRKPATKKQRQAKPVVEVINPPPVVIPQAKTIAPWELDDEDDVAA